MIPRTAAKPLIRPEAIVVIILAIALSGCSKSQTQSRPSPEIADPLLRERLAKDEAFKSDPDSPLREESKASFQGLDYYPINPDLRFSVKLNRHPSPKQIRMATNTGEIRRGLRYGYFDFQVSGRNCQLQVYRLEDASGSTASLFIPFRDSTSGQETYASGRYIDLKENTSGAYELDFNRAYNPYCAYNGEFSCPVPPAENTLPVPIFAGEKKYDSGGKN